jgi:hypothetical protein
MPGVWPPLSLTNLRQYTLGRRHFWWHFSSEPIDLKNLIGAITET